MLILAQRIPLDENKISYHQEEDWLGELTSLVHAGKLSHNFRVSSRKGVRIHSWLGL